MNRFRKIVEDTLNKVNDPFIIRLISTCGTTNNLLEGGLILPDGQIIKVFSESTISYYDLVSKVYSATSSLNDNPDLLEEFDIQLEDHGIIKYSLGHDFQPNFIILPTLQITDIQKVIVQKIINSLSDVGIITVMTDEDIFKEISATKDSKITDLIDKLMLDENTELDEEKVYDKDSGYNVSEDENYYYDMIKKKWPDAEKSVTLDWFRNPENNRPWQIDVLLPDEKTIIMSNGHIKHGRRPYNPEDPDCQKDVEWLKKQKGEFYDKILYTWTELDPMKRQVAKENGYKYLEFFDIAEFNRWYENPDLTYEEYKDAPESLQYDREEYFDKKAQGIDLYGNSVKPHYNN